MTDIDVALKGATLLPLETPHLVLSRTLDGPDVYWRYDSYVYFCDFGEPSVSVYETAYPVIRRTRQCVILDGHGRERRVLAMGGGKRWAYKDRAEAWRSFKKRKLWAIEYAKNDLRKAETALKAMEALDGPGRDYFPRKEGV
jgi:hypothetical protein